MNDLVQVAMMKNAVASGWVVCCFGMTVCLAEEPAKDAPQPMTAGLPDSVAETLVAWCIAANFDASGRSPEERAEMLNELGIRYCAYDWRPGQEDRFEAEILAYQENGIEMMAFWKGNERAFALFRKHGIRPQLWRTVHGESGETFEDKVQSTVVAMAPFAEQAASYGGILGLYNHGGWGGEPESLVAVCEGLQKLGYENVGIAYNFHHAHDEIDQWAEVFPKMMPYLLCLNLNGMTRGEVTKEAKIMPLGQGEAELEMLRVVFESGYDGPIGIIDHEPEKDAREMLETNLNGLRKLMAELK